MNNTNKGFHDILEILSRRKWLIIIPLLLGAGIGGWIAYTLPPIFMSSTLIMVEQQKVPEAYVKATDETPIESRLNTISQQIMSRTKLEQIVTDFNLYKEKGNSPYAAILKWVGIAPSSKISNEELIENMRKKIEIKVHGQKGGQKGGDAFTISFTGSDPSVTMQVTNALASLFIEENLKVREQYAEGTSEFLADELEKAKQELENQETALKSFKERYMGRLPEQMEANLRTLDRLQMELQSTHAALKNTEDRKTLLEEQRDALSETSSTPLEGELTRLKGELSTLLSTYKENYPDVIITKKRIKEVEEQLADAWEKEPVPQVTQSRGNQRADMTANLSLANSQIDVLKKQEVNIRNQIKVYQKRVEDTPESEQVMADIERNYETSQKNYQALLEKKMSASLAENMEKRQKGERFRVIDPANLPEKPIKPDRIKVALGGSAVGLGLGAGLVYLLEFLNPAFRRPDDFNGVLDKPILAVIPVLNLERKEGKVKELRLIKEHRESAGKR